MVAENLKIPGEDLLQILYATDEFNELISEMGKVNLYSNYGIHAWNPDILASRKGIRIYEIMENDDIIRPISELKKHAILSREIVVDNKCGADDDIVAFAQYLLNECMAIPLRMQLYDILGALTYGYTASEIVFYPIMEGEFQGRVGLKYLKAFDPKYTYYTLDDCDDIKSMTYGLAQEITLEKYKFMHFAPYSKYRNPYGTSDFRAAYRPWFLKDNALKFWGIYLEKFASPHVIGKYPLGLEDKPNGQAIIAKMTAIMARIRSGGHSLVPDIMDPEWQDLGSGADYNTAVTMFNTMITRAMLATDNLGFTTSKYGSRASADTQTDTFWIVIEELGDRLLHEFNSQVLIPLLKLNFISDKYPTFKFLDPDKKDKEKFSQIAERAKRTGYMSINDIKDVNTMRMESGFEPIPEDQFDVWMANRQETENTRAALQHDEYTKHLSRFRDIREQIEMQDDGDATPEMFQKIRDDLDKADAEAEKAVKKILDERSNDVQMAATEAAANTDVAFIQKLNLERARINTAIENHFASMVEAGERDVKKEIEELTGGE